MTDELVADRLYRLDLGIVNASLVDTGETTLVDAGMPNAVDDLRGELDEAGYDERDIDRVLITHFDLVHVGTLAHAMFDCPIYAMEPDASYSTGPARHRCRIIRGIAATHRLLADPPVDTSAASRRRRFGRGIRCPSRAGAHTRSHRLSSRDTGRCLSR